MVKPKFSLSKASEAFFRITDIEQLLIPELQEIVTSYLVYEEKDFYAINYSTDIEKRDYNIYSIIHGEISYGIGSSSNKNYTITISYYYGVKHGLFLVMCSERSWTSTDAKGNYYYGIKHGQFHWHDKRLIITYDKGILHGYYKNFSEDTKIEGFYKNNKKDREWRVYKFDYSLVEIQEWKDDVLVDSIKL